MVDNQIFLKVFFLSSIQYNVATMFVYSCIDAKRV